MRSATPRRRSLQELAAKTLRRQSGELPRVERRVRRREHDVRGSREEGDRAGRRLRRPRSSGDNDINAFTKRSVAGLAGQGLVVAARDNYPRNGASQSFVAGFAEVEVDVETGAYHILEFAAIADCRHRAQPAEPAGPDLRRRHARHRPRDRPEVGLRPALRGAARQAVPLQQAADDPRCAGACSSSPRSTSPDPETPVGARGIGEPPVGAGLGAILNALAAAVGDEVFRRAPVNADMILTSLESGAAPLRR